jgi:protein SCO1/2
MGTVFKKVTFIIFGLIILLAGVSMILEEEKQLPVLGTLPEFSLTNATGDPIGLDDLDGKVWAADFIFTTCAGPCPVMSMHMSKLHQDFIEDDRIRMVSVSVNPDYDTPEVLTEYAKRYEARTDLWYFLTGAYESIQSLIANGFKMGDMEDIVFHSTRFALVDGEGQIRGYYTGTEPDEVERLKKDIRTLADKLSK